MEEIKKSKELVDNFIEKADEFVVKQKDKKIVYLKDSNGDYWFEADHSYLVGPVTKEQAQPMSESNAKSIIAKSPYLIMEDE